MHISQEHWKQEKQHRRYKQANARWVTAAGAMAAYYASQGTHELHILLTHDAVLHSTLHNKALTLEQVEQVTTGLLKGIFPSFNVTCNRKVDYVCQWNVMKNTSNR